MQYVVGLVIGGLIAYYIYNDSGKRGMNQVVWAVCGFLFGLLTLINLSSGPQAGAAFVKYY